MSSKGKAAAAAGVGIAAAVAIIIFVTTEYDIAEVKGADQNSNSTEPEEVWNTAGAFGINRHTYKLGEDIFFAGRLAPDQQVLVRIANPEGKIIVEKFFNGIDRELVKFYFKPDTSASKGIYTKDQIIGKWMIWFEGINNDEIYFEIIDEFVPGAETDIVDIEGGRPDSSGNEEVQEDMMQGPVQQQQQSPGQ